MRKEIKLHCPKEHFSKYRLLTRANEVEEYLAEYVREYRDKIFVFDSETTGLKIDNILLGLSFYDTMRPPVFIPTDDFFDIGIPINTLVQICNKYFPKIKLGVAHNAKYDGTVLKKNGFHDIKVHADTLAMVHAYSPDLQRGLEKRVYEDYGYAKKTFKELIGKNWDKIKWQAEGNELLDTLAAYACEDTVWEGELYFKYSALLDKDNLLAVHDKIEVPMTYVLRDMWLRGVECDVSILDDMDVRMESEMSNTIHNIYLEAGCVFNLNSPKQKADILFNKLKLPKVKKTKSGGDSTDVDTLEHLAKMGHVIAGHMCDYSELQKLRSGYVQAIPRMVDADGALRCNLNSCGTRTGRFSCDSPNLQNQPNNKQFPVRSSFVARPGYKLICADYSQIELRVMAHVSKDERFMTAFMTGEDIHAAVGRDLGITRDQGKTVNFAVLYGVGPDKLGGMLGMSVEQAKAVLRKYEKTYPGFYKWKTDSENKAIRYGIVRNPFGRIRRLPGAMTDEPRLKYGALRQAINTICQGGAADIIKLAMIELHREYKEQNLDAHLTLQVHDELLVEARIDHACAAYDIMKHVMENTTKLIVPLEVEGKIIDNWAQMKDKTYVSQYDDLKSGKIIEPVKTLKHEIPTWLTSLI